MAGDGSSFWCETENVQLLDACAYTKQEGLLTVVIATAAYGFIHNYPATARFLTDRERAYIHERLKRDSDATRDEAFTWGNVSKAFKDPKVWLYGLGFHTMSLPLYTLSLFLVRTLKSQTRQPADLGVAYHHSTAWIYSGASTADDSPPLQRRFRPHDHDCRVLRTVSFESSFHHS